MTKDFAIQPLFRDTQPQTLRITSELQESFGGSLAHLSTGDPSQNCNLIYSRLFLENYPIRNTIFVLNVYGEHSLLRFATIESTAEHAQAKERLVAQINFAVRKAGLTFVYEESATYELTNEEFELSRQLVPEAYRVKIESLGIDWKQAQ